MGDKSIHAAHGGRAGADPQGMQGGPPHTLGSSCHRDRIENVEVEKKGKGTDAGYTGFDRSVRRPQSHNRGPDCGAPWTSIDALNREKMRQLADQATRHDCDERRSFDASPRWLKHRMPRRTKHRTIVVKVPSLVLAN
jgi:hypothetical protein